MHPDEYTYLYGTYFDEIYHARTAYEHLVGMWPYEISHPPLGKIIMGLGITLFGMNPFGWRSMGTLAGVLMLPFLYLLSKRMFKNTMGAFTATTLFAFDFMHFVQTRIATIDSYAVLFIVIMYYFMYRFVSERNGRCLALSGICFGLGAASKWICIYAGIGLGVIWIIHWIIRLREGEWKAFAKNVGFCLVWFAAVPVLIYYMSYYPYGESQGMQGIGMYFDPRYAKIVWDNQVSMFTYHVGVDATHPYSSTWYQWIFDIRPILYYLHYGAGTRGSIAAFLSPLVCWGGLLAMVGMGYLAMFRKDTKAAFILLGYLAQLLPWVFVSRIVFHYHYFACTVFLCLALGYVAAVLDKAGQRGKVYAINGVGVALFVLFYPALSGILVATSYGDNVMKWLSSWPL
ncbi:MAG: glycosyltransferase family 39 protein [Oscillospiraceae bacterium]|nr:glycosyltransferase family 39 protein [Oscillospiraceae bacterium]